MNVQAHMSGQITGQVPNQAGNQMPGLPQQNGNTFHTPMQNLGGQSNPSVMDSEVIKIRQYMRNRVFEILMMRQSQPSDQVSKKIHDISKRLEDGLFKSAATKEEYLNMSTLESRLHAYIKRVPQNQQASQQSQFMNSSTPVGTMIPTPGMQHSGNSNLMVSSAMDSSIISASGSMASSTSTSGSLMPTSNGSFSSLRGGSMSNGFEQSPSTFSMNSSGNNVMAGQRVASQMIPTPGFSSNSNHTVMNVDNTSNGGVFSSVDSSVLPQQVPQRHVGGQNSRVLQNLGSVMGSGMRSLMQQRLQNGSMSSGFGNNLHTVNGSGSSDSYLNTASFGASSRPLQQPLDPHPRPVMQGDAYRLGAADSSGTGNFYNPATPIGSLMNNQNLNQVRPQSISRANSVMNNQSNLQAAQSASYVRPQLADQVEKFNVQSSQSPRDSHSQSSIKQYQQQPHQLTQQQQYTAYRQQRQSIQPEQAFVRTDAFVQSQMASDLGNHMKAEPGTDHQNDVLQSQVSCGQMQVPELRSQLQQNSNGNHLRISQMSSLPSGSEDVCSALLQNPPHMMSDDGTNQYSCVQIGAQPEPLLHGQWRSESERSCLPGSLPPEQHVQEEFRQRVGGHDEAQRNNLSSEGSVIGLAGTSRGTVKNSSLAGPSCGSGSAIRDQQFKKQIRWLLFLRHARCCRAPEGKCKEANCSFAQKLWRHMGSCNVNPCPQPFCTDSKKIMCHYRSCMDPSCPVCIPVKKFIRTQNKGYPQLCSSSGLPGSGSCKSSESGDTKAKENLKPSEMVVETSENLQPSLKRLKAELPPQPVIPDSGSMSLPRMNSTSRGSQEVQVKEIEKNDKMQIKSEFMDVKAEISSGSNPSVSETKNITVDTSCNQSLDGAPVMNDSNSSAKEEHVKAEKDSGQVKPEVAQPSEHGAGTKSGKPKIKGVSLTELFTPEQIREHITGLRQWVGQSKAKAEKNQAMENSMSENSCQLCAVEKLTFEPPPIYCTPCGARIKRNAMYYTVGAGDTRHFFCIPCYNEARGDTIVADTTAIPKSRLEKKKNDEETEEWWVQCDKCEAWQHQICALFNGRRNDGGQAEYTCPNCYVEEIERGERKPLPQSAVLGAKDLPRTILSDHIEHRLFLRLKHERQERARVQGRSYDEVPGADGIVVRVVSSVDKKLEVKPRFLEIFRDENYPMEFPYKSKVVLLFQKIEGVEVCLFGMYVQEFGSECLPPNQRRVYLSYLDSVKYFRPDVRTVTGEALRTFVYHEILIGYLEYCKLRGFTSCYIWACPPLKGEDYILYCHPEIQKTPKSDKLREWYLSMLRKAAKENIVVDLINLYDHFFMQTGECKAKVTAARLPYFDGDYWPGAAEDMIYQINQEEEGRKQNKKGTTKKMITKRALKASGQSDLSSNASKDLLLMHKLGETISPMKEDFIMVHLQHACSHCCWLMVSGNRWVCNQCKNFQLCDKCYEAEQKRDDRERHPINQKDKHALYPVEITGVPEDTKDKDEILESEFFDTRQAFLSLCQGNHYQYDTLRRAKHSSMMVLYHLHNPTAPAFVTTCNICHNDIETGQGWRCETCPDYDVCNGCYKDGGINHPHKLTNHPSIADRDAQNKEARQLRVVQLRKMLDLLVHASQCRSMHCQYPNCRKVKGLFRHGLQCRTRASGGCLLCKRMWYLLQLHARACKESQCNVPRCRDLKEHIRRMQQQSDSRRRAAVMEMMRQRAAEVAGNS